MYDWTEWLEVDPWRRCPFDCRHELPRGVLVSELLTVDGPHLTWPWWFDVNHIDVIRVATITSDGTSSRSKDG